MSVEIVHTAGAPRRSAMSVVTYQCFVGQVAPQRAKAIVAVFSRHCTR